MIEPIGAEQQAAVTALTQDYVKRADAVLEQGFAPIEVCYDLSGTSVGMFKVEADHCFIRYNPWLFAKYFEENLSGTVPHEVAHYIVHCLYGRRRLRPHGAEWLDIMELFEADSRVTCDFDMTDIPQRKQRRFDYTCGCRIHELSTRRHNAIQQRRHRYQCLHCGDDLRRSRTA